MAAMNAPITAPCMDWEAADVVAAFARFKQKCELMFQSVLMKASDGEKASYLLLWTGEKGIEMFNSWTFTNEADKKVPKVLLEKFQQHLEPKTHHRIHRYTFQGLQQSSGESIDDFLTKLKNIAAKCKFRDGEELEDRVLDQFIWGTSYKDVQKALIGKSEELTLQAAVDIARAHEATDRQMSLMSHTSGRQVDAVKATRPKNGGLRKETAQQTKQKTCYKCGRQHDFRKKQNCPAYGTVCKKCGKKNHWEAQCQGGKQPSLKQTPHKKVHAQIEDQSNDQDFLDIGAIQIDNINNEEKPLDAFTKIRIKRNIKARPTNINLKVKLDSGAQSNLLPLRLYQQIFPERIDQEGRPKPGSLEPSIVNLSAYGDAPIPHLGKTVIRGSIKDRETKVNEIFFVTDSTGPAILGLTSCLKLGLITLNLAVQTTTRIDPNTPTELRPPIKDKEDLIQMYPECFNDTVGCFEHYEYHITVDPDVPPVVHPPRRVALELKEKLQAELEEMEAKGIITKVETPTEWVNSIVVKEKPNGKLRICLDPRDLNKALKRDHYPTPTLEEITPHLAGAQVFSKLDARNGYWNIKIDEESSLLTTFNTPFGRYRFKRLPFGLKVSQDVFQRKIDQAYVNCRGAVGIADDIQVYGKTNKDHDQNLHEAMERTRKSGIKLNADKCIIKTQECSFFGMIYSPEGVRPDPAKVQTINNMEPPNDKKELRSFLGLIQYMGSFIPKLADHTANLRELLKEDMQYVWSASHTQDFNRIKQLISSETTLQYYDRQKPVTLQTDASMKGVGAVLLQDGKPIAFASKALTPAETRYANIERELLAVVYGCEKFHTYLYGRNFVIETDHRPLEQIDKKNLTKAPARLQRLLLRLQSYDYSITYIPGKDMLIADALSRISPNEKQEIEGMDIKIHHMVNVSDNKLDVIRRETSKDEELQILAQVITQGWPEKRNQLQPIIRDYWSIRDDISIENGILMAGSRIIIPGALQQEILSRIHQGHPGIEKSKLRAKSAVYWKGMYKDIEQMVSKCQACQKYQNSQQKEEMMTSEVPSRPWKVLGADLFTENQQWYLILACYYSKFPFVKKVKDLRAATIIREVRELFAEQGIPEQIICDNGTQFTSQEFKLLANEYGFQVTTSSPHYPKGHGFIERQVQTVKKALIKCREMKEDPNLALLSLRATPLKADLKSPAELLNGRKYQTTLPAKIQVPIDQEDTRAKLEAAQKTGQSHYNQHAHSLPELYRGQHVHVQDPITKIWTPAKIVNRAETPRSYIIEMDSGRQLRRNRVHIRPTPPPATPTTSRESPTTAKMTPTTPDATPSVASSSFNSQMTAPHDTPNRQKSSYHAAPPLTADLATTKSTRTRSNILPPARYR